MRTCDQTCEVRIASDEKIDVSLTDKCFPLLARLATLWEAPFEKHSVLSYPKLFNVFMLNVFRPNESLFFF